MSTPLTPRSDIKPENLLFYPIPYVPSNEPVNVSQHDEDKAPEGAFIPGSGSGGIGVIKLADFGLSKVIWEDTTVTPCGTVGYTAPEIVKDERYSKSVDMWALGCVLYTLLCGFPPFYDESISVLTEKVAKGQYTFLSPWWDEISKSAQDLVSHLLTVDPNHRYDINQFLEHPWIKNTQEPTQPARDAPPLATPAVEKLGFSQGWEEQETPGRRMDFRSPGAVSLREVFDVGYAVHRMEEENKRRKGWTGMEMGNLNEEDEIEEEDEEMTDQDMARLDSQLRKTSISAAESGHTMGQSGMAPAPGLPPPGTAVPQGASAYSTHVQKQRAPPKSSTAKRRGHGFELNMDNATLLGRRKRGGEETVAG